MEDVWETRSFATSGAQDLRLAEGPLVTGEHWHKAMTATEESHRHKLYV